ncbi:MAG: exopolysaccharide biosynthesis protein [Bdellovibrionia bacterium]
MAKEKSLSQSLQELLAQNSEEKLTIGKLFSAMGERGFGLALILTSLPSALPLPAAGYSTPFGILLMILALQIIRGRHQPFIPAWAAKIVIPEALAKTMIKGATAFLSKLELFIKPRWGWANSRFGHLYAALIVLIMGFVMFLPIPGTNTAPAGVIFLVGVAMTEEDGLFLLLASILGLFAVLFYGVILSLLFYYGASGVGEVLTIIKGYLG